MKKVLFLLMAMFAFGLQSVNAQIKIVSGHPDLKIKVSRCVANGKSVFLDLALTNEGVNDVDNFHLFINEMYRNKIVCYDDLGNIYEENIFAKVANRKEYANEWTGEFNLPADVPIKINIRIDNFSTSAESIARITLPFECEEWGLDYNKPAKITNIPISRD